MILALLPAGSVLGPIVASAAQQERYALGRGAQSLALNTVGSLLAWPGSSLQKAPATSLAAGELRYGGRSLKLANPDAVTRTATGLLFKYRWPDEPELELIVGHHFTSERKGWLWTRELQVKGPGRLKGDLTVSLQTGLPSLPEGTWLPLVNGLGSRLGTNPAAAYRFAGALPAAGSLLALPMISVPVQTSRPGQNPSRFLIAADPFFSVLFTPTALEWTYPAKAGLENGCEKRTIVVSLHDRSPEQSLERFFKTVLREVPPGPQWLHEIAMVDYDYLSDGGQGWFHDIDALSTAISRRDRHQVLLCLHGWYDFLGRYCFDSRTGKLDEEWVAFSSYETAKKAPAFGVIGGERVETGFGNCKPVNMSLQAVHTRLAYARSRGFRVGLYFADGTNAGEGLPDYEPSRVLRWGGWQGADSKGRSYFQNPLHPKVRTFYLDYTRALLDEFGSEIDALNWDETFHIAPGELGTEAAPGYADRAMMRLVREISCVVEEYNRKHRRQIAFLTSDCQGAFGQELKAPYAMMAHGTFQDSWCQPQAWSYGIFANYRNVLWSCCWWPETKWSWIDFGVRAYQAPVAVSNGWGNDTGFSEMTNEQRARAMALFEWRKKQPTKLRWFTELPAYRQ